MNRWEKFENECFENIKNILNEHNINLDIIQNGGSNSNFGDIDLYKNNNLITNIECKLSPSQSGQFVITEEVNGYVLSSRNKFSNRFSEKILSIINDRKLKPKSQKGLEIILPNSILKEWITEHYSTKNSQFIMTSQNLNSFKAILPFKDIEKYFNMTAILRRKKSGSHNIPIKHRETTKQIVKDFIIKNNFKLTEFQEENDKLYVIMDCLNNTEDKYYLNNNTLFLRRLKDQNKNKYIIKKLSKTNNLTVIFQLEYIGPSKNIGYQEFLNYILNNI